MPRLRCPLCAKEFDSERSAALPFCSVRCQQIDLGRWLSEEYGFPQDDDDEPDESIDLNGEDS